MGFECYNSEEGPRHEDEGEGDLKAPNVLYQSTANNEFLIAQVFHFFCYYNVQFKFIYFFV